MNLTVIIFIAMLVVAGIVLYRIASKVKKVVVQEFTKDHYKIDNLVESLRERVNTEINADLTELNISPSELNKREQSRLLLSKNTRECCLGDPGEREYVKDILKEWLQRYENVNERSVNFIIPFDSPEDMTTQDKFEYMYSMYKREYGQGEFKHMVNDFGWTNLRKGKSAGERLTDEDINKAYDNCPFSGSYDDKLNTVVQRIYEKMYGHDVADIFIMDSSIDSVSAGVGGKTRVDFNYIEEIHKNNEGDNTIVRTYDVLYIVFKGRLIRLSFLSFGTAKTLERVTKNIYQYKTKVALSQKNPVLQSSLKNNSRVMVWRPPVSDCFGFIVRKFDSTAADEIETLVVDNNKELIIEFMKCLVRADFNFTISGNTGGGKTTLLKALVNEIPDNYCIRTAETTFELNLNNLYPYKNIQAMQERGDFTVYDAITATKKLDTDVLILGEMNEPRIAGAFIQVAQSGSRSAITTLHHETTAKLIEYFRNALVAEVGISDVRIAEQQVIDCLQFDIHQIRDASGKHYIERITEIIPRQFPEWPDELDKASMEYYRRRTDDSLFSTKDIFTFNRETCTYEVKNNVSKKSADKFRWMLGNERTDRLLASLDAGKLLPMGSTADGVLNGPEKADASLEQPKDKVDVAAAIDSEEALFANLLGSDEEDD